MSRDCTLNAFDPGGLGGGELSIFQVSVNLLRLVFGRNVNGNAVKMLL